MILHWSRFSRSFFKIWAILGLFSDYYCKAFYKHDYNRHIDDQLAISAPCWLGVSSRPGLTQRQEGVQGRFAPPSLGYLQAGVVTMAPIAVDTMSSWCSVGFIEDDLVCNFEEQIKVRTEYRMKMSITRSQFVIEQFLLSKFEREVARFLTVKFRKKANSNYELNLWRCRESNPRPLVWRVYDRNSKRYI